MDSLFNSQAYLDGTAHVCGGKTVLDPVQLGMIILLPGQSVCGRFHRQFTALIRSINQVPLHLDVPNFFGSTRFNTPQYILIAMEFSGLFESRRVRQSQGVAYIHSWYNKETDAGNFFFYPNGTQGGSVAIPAVVNTGISVDGTVVVSKADIAQ